MSYAFNVTAIITYVGNITKSLFAVDDIFLTDEDLRSEDLTTFADSAPYFAELFTEFNANITIPQLESESDLVVQHTVLRFFCQYSDGEENFAFSVFRDDAGVLSINGNGTWEHFCSLYRQEIEPFLNGLWPGISLNNTEGEDPIAISEPAPAPTLDPTLDPIAISEPAPAPTLDPIAISEPAPAPTLDPIAISEPAPAPTLDPIA